MFTNLLAQHFVHNALVAGAIVALVSGAIGWFVVTRGASFAVHAISELGFTGAAGALDNLVQWVYQNGATWNPASQH